MNLSILSGSYVDPVLFEIARMAGKLALFSLVAALVIGLLVRRQKPLLIALVILFILICISWVILCLYQGYSVGFDLELIFIFLVAELLGWGVAVGLRTLR